MHQRTRETALILGSLLIFSLILAACGGAAAEPTATPEPIADEHMDEHMDEHAMDEHDMEAMHGIPEDAAAVPNPVAADEVSVSAGSQLFAANCATCHGENGMGDGPAAAGLDPKPANLHEDHVQALTDGALFYIVSNGVEGTAMPAWGESLGESDLWNVVNFMRTFGEG